MHWCSTYFHKLEFDMLMFIRAYLIFLITFVGNIHGKIGNTAVQ